MRIMCIVALACGVASAALPAYADDEALLARNREIIAKIDALLQPHGGSAFGHFCMPEAGCIRFQIRPTRIAIGDTVGGYALVDDGNSGTVHYAEPFRDSDTWLDRKVPPISDEILAKGQALYTRDIELVLDYIQMKVAPQ